MEWIIIAILSILLIIVFCLYKEKCKFAKAVEEDKQNLKAAYQKGIAKDQKELVEKSEILKRDNAKLLSENKSLVKEMLEKDSLFKKLKRDNENLKDENIKILKELQLERHKIVDKENTTNSEDKEKIRNYQEKILILEDLKDSSMKKIEQLQIINEKLSIQVKEQDNKIERYKEYVAELTNDISEFEEAYVAIGGKLSDIYDDYEE